MRLENKISETIPSSRISPDLYIHISSSVHLTQFLQASGQRTGMTSRSVALCSVTPFCVVFEVCVWIIVWLEDPNTAYYKISNRVSQV